SWRGSSTVAAATSGPPADVGSPGAFGGTEAAEALADFVAELIGEAREDAERVGELVTADRVAEQHVAKRHVAVLVEREGAERQPRVRLQEEALELRRERHLGHEPGQQLRH